MWPGSWAMFTAAVAAFLNSLLHDPDAATTDLADDPVIADLSGSWDGGGKGRGINRPSLLHHDQGREQAANLVHESGVREIVLASEFWRIPLRNSRIRRLHNSPLLTSHAGRRNSCEFLTFRTPNLSLKPTHITKTRSFWQIG